MLFLDILVISETMALEMELNYLGILNKHLILHLDVTVVYACISVINHVCAEQDERHSEDSSLAIQHCHE